jgi:hypothetical protein
MTHVAYDERIRMLTIVFPDGRMYDYKRVPYDIWQALMNAISKGEYYNEHIKYNYDFIERDTRAVA